MVATDIYSIMSPPDSPPMAQHWEGRPAQTKQTMAGKTGRLAPRWVHDLLNSELDVGMLASVQWDPNACCSHKAAPHNLALVGNQSTAEARNPGVLSCVCTKCDFHFIIRTSWNSDQIVCLCQPFPIHFPPKDTDFYLHHLVNVQRPPQTDAYISEYHPLIRESHIAVEHFACSVPRCTFEVSVEISGPRLKRKWVQLLVDQQRILDNLARARKASPDRFADARDDWCTSAPSTLNTYLRDLLDKPNPRNISQRNKRFQVVFGEECYAIFRAIQFTEESIDKDGTPEPYFIPPSLEPGTPGTPTKMSTLRAFVEDMQAEAESLIIRSGKSEENRAVGNRLIKELQCLDYPRSKVQSPAIEAHRTLGVLPDFDKALIFYAYNRQSSCCEKRRPDFVQALRDIAQETADDEFQTRAIQELTIVERLPTADYHGAGDELEQQAYSFFSLQYTASDDAVITAFNSKIENSPSQADFAREMLQIIGRHRSSDRILNHANGPMDVASAYRILEVDPLWPDSTISMMCSVKLNKNLGNQAIGALAVEALGSIATDRNSDELREGVASLKAEIARMEQQPQGNQEFPDASGGGQENATPRLDLPAGLENIGNTCYLNSILQYLRTVIPIRLLLARYQEYQLGQSESDVAARRVGGNKLKIVPAEAVIARIFVEELGRLLDDLDNTKETAIRPSQRLANAVLLPTTQIEQESNAVEAKESEGPRTQEVMGAQFPIPPPLPARPAPVPPAQSVGQVEDVNMVNVTVDPVSESASSVSSQTLVGLPDVDQENADYAPEDKSDIRLITERSETLAPQLVADDDVPMTGVSAPVLSVEQRVLKALETQKRSSGTDQQDVEEVMGSIINRLQAAIRPTDVDADGIQWEPIMRTFYVELTNHTRMTSQEKFKSDSTLERAITAYPAEGGPSTIHEGLSRNFDLQRVVAEKGEDIMRFTSIKSLPPILHVLIQRTKNDGRKNMNPVEVSEMLYLDRYMDTPENAEFLKLKHRGWALQQRLEQLNSISKTPAEDSQIIDSFVNDFVFVNRGDAEENSSVLVGQPSSSLAFAGEEVSFPSYAPQSRPIYEKVDLPETTDATLAGREQIMIMREEEVKKHKAELDELFSQHKQHAYRLHAVICHSGQLNAGHYWVWIHDFEDGIWRKYNDRTVTENAGTDEVLKTLNSNGDPYYLCYVQEEKKLDLVRVPKRKNSDTVVADRMHSYEEANKDNDGDVDLVDAGEKKTDAVSNSQCDVVPVPIDSAHN